MSLVIINKSELNGKEIYIVIIFICVRISYVLCTNVFFRVGNWNLYVATNGLFLLGISCMETYTFTYLLKDGTY